MSRDTIPALALGYIIVASIITCWFGIKHVVILADTSNPVAIAAIIYIACAAIVARNLTR